MRPMPGVASTNRAEIEMMEEIKKTGMVCSVVVHDHLIIGNGRHLPFRKNGLLMG
jgi:DNA repair protein RadC